MILRRPERLFAPIRDISARIPPSPRLSARMTNRQYLIEMVMISVQTMSERMPSALCAVNFPPSACTTVCRVYSGLVPRSPKTMPRAVSEASGAEESAPGGVEAVAEVMQPAASGFAIARMRERRRLVRAQRHQRRLQPRECRRRIIGELEQIEILAADHAMTHECVEVEDFPPEG